MMTSGAVFQHKAAVAIGTFDEVVVAHFQIDPRMAQATPDAVAGDAPGLNFNDFGGFYGHGNTLLARNGGIIALNPCLARG